jgi:hypothetical protein
MEEIFNDYAGLVYKFEHTDDKNEELKFLLRYFENQICWYVNNIYKIL